ncbi:hypothetical protein Ancab_026219 [Ancistrocladus abbreviatus]
MALLGDDGRGYELARRLEACGIWRSWLGDSLYANFVRSLSSPSSWEAFMRVDESKSRAQIQLQLRARALLFDKATVSLFLRNPLPTLSSSKLNPHYLQLHGDDVYFTLEDGGQQREGVASSTAPWKPVANSTGKCGGNAIFVSASIPTYELNLFLLIIFTVYVFWAFMWHSEFESDNLSQVLRQEDFPDTWYNLFIEKYRVTRPYRLQTADRDPNKRSPSEMCHYLKLIEMHKRRRIAFKEDQYAALGNSVMENRLNMQHTSVLDGDASGDDGTHFFPETMFMMNCVPDSAIAPRNTGEDRQKVELFGVRGRTRVVSEGKRNHLSQEQAVQMSKKVVAHVLTTMGFEGASEMTMEVLSQFLGCHVGKLGRTLKVLADSYRKQCSAIELLRMFLNTTGYGNVAALAQHVKDGRNSVQKNSQQMQGIQPTNVVAPAECPSTAPAECPSTSPASSSTNATADAANGPSPKSDVSATTNVGENAKTAGTVSSTNYELGQRQALG